MGTRTSRQKVVVILQIIVPITVEYKFFFFFFFFVNKSSMIPSRKYSVIIKGLENMENCHEIHQLNLDAQDCLYILRYVVRRKARCIYTVNI